MAYHRCDSQNSPQNTCERIISNHPFGTHVEPKTDKKRIYRVKQIGNQYGIIVEELKNKSVTQCRRCWRFEHTISNCTYDPRCNKCLETHSEGKCALDDNNALRPACVNCKKENHEATSKECPIYLRIAERRNNAGNKSAGQSTTIQTPSTNRKNGEKRTSFEDTVRSGASQDHSAKNLSANETSDLKSFLKQLLVQQSQMNNFLMRIET